MSPGGQWIQLTPTPISECSYTVTGLIPCSTDNQFRVRAVNILGVKGPVIAKTNKITACDVPDQPGKPVVAGNRFYRSVTISYQPPDDGGSPVIRYIVQMKKSKKEEKKKEETVWNIVGDNMTKTEYEVKNLEEGYKYQFRVLAVNSSGSGRLSEPSDPFTYGELDTTSDI